MTLVIILVLVGLLFGVGAMLTTAKWLLIIALALWLLGALSYGSYYRHNNHHHY